MPGVAVLDRSGTDAPRAPIIRLSSISFEIVADGLVASAGPGETPWRAVLAVEGVETGDARFIDVNALTWRTLPLSMGYQDTIPDGFNGHAGAVMSGRIDEIHRDTRSADVAYINAEGVFTADEEGRKAADGVRSRKIRGVSVDVAAVESREDLTIDGESGEVLSARLVLVSGEIMGAIVTPHPAFAESTIEVTGDTVSGDGTGDALPLAAGAGLASNTKYGLDRFTDPILLQATPLTVTEPDEYGVREVYGHAALWGQCHVGFSDRCVTPPPSPSNYKWFHVGAFRLDDGTDLPVGRLTVGGSHAGIRLNTQEAMRHYDDLTMVAAFVRAGEDQYGIWVHGVMREDITEGELRLIQSGAPSGDWRTPEGTRDMIAVHQVGTPGFPVPRALAASARFVEGEMVALIASGVPRDLRCADDEDEDEVDVRFSRLEDLIDAQAETIAALTAKVDGLARFAVPPLSIR